MRKDLKMSYTTSFGDLNSEIKIGPSNDPVNLNFHKEFPDLHKELPVVDGAAFNSYDNQHEGRCLPGTRIDLLHQIKEWAFSPHGRCIFWLNGMAGTGKTTISRTVAEIFSEAKSLGASFFFKRGEADRGSAKWFFPTIARQLTISIPQLLPHVKQAVLDNSGITGKGLKEQFDKLLLQPLLALRQSDLPVNTIAIVIDALDECQGDNDIRLILQLLPQLQKLDTLHVRVFLTSRPELPIRLGFSKIAIQDHKDLILHEIPEEVIEHDISLFLHWRLSVIRSNSFLPDDWPGDANIKKLVALSVPLFAFAATICRIFEDPNSDPRDSLTEILAHRHDKSNMDRTYLPVLDRLLIGQTERKKKQLIEEFQQVVGPIGILEEPLSVISLSKLLNLPERLIQLRLKPLQSVLKIPTDGILPVRLFHLSFRDFLLDPKTCGKTPFAVDKTAAHYRLTIKCLLMCQNLRKNICELSSDGTQRAEIDRQTINQYIPSELQYSCRYWVYHLVECVNLSDVIYQALSFLQKHFLHWMEAMCLLGLASEIIAMLNRLQSAIPGDQYCIMYNFIQDAKRFSLKNLQIADEAPLQIYSIGLTFAPKRSIVRKTFENEIPTWIHPLPRVGESWSAELQTLEGHLGDVRSVAFSPDGWLLASASGDGTVRLWNPATGMLQQTLEGHEGAVHSVVFSPDSRLLASGSLDKTIRLWDQATGALQQTLEGHEGAVYSVAFSPDGRLLASASWGKTVRLWDPATGALRQTLEGHEGAVYSVAFSPDGRLLASASWGKTVRLWDPATGALQQTLEAHLSGVSSVAFSPDGQLLASASGDKTVRLWDPATGALQQTLEAHPSGVSSVAFSPDGQLLASASGDKTVRLWDPATGALQQTLEAHLSGVSSVAFSPDGQLLASASGDKTVRLWDPATGALHQAQGNSFAVQRKASGLPITEATSEITPNEQDEQASVTEASNILWSDQADSTNLSSVSHEANVDIGQVTEDRSSMTFFNYKNTEIEDKSQKRDDDIQSVRSIPDDIESLVESNSGLINYQQAAVNYIVKTFTGDQELLILYQEAIQLMDEAKFVRNHRRLLKKFFLNLRSEGHSPAQKRAIEFLRPRSKRTHISSAIRSLVVPFDNTFREKINIIIEQEKNSLFLLDRLLDERGFTAQATPKNTADEAFSVEPGIKISSSGDSDIASEDSEDSDNDDDIQNDTALSNLEATAEFLISGRSFGLFKESLRGFLHPRSEAEHLQENAGTITAEQSEPLVWNLRKELRNSLQLDIEESGRFLPRLPLLVDMILQCWPLPVSEPPIPKGKVRARWDCQCGLRLFDDFTELEFGSVKELEIELQDLGCSTQRNRDLRTTLFEFLRVLWKPAEHYLQKQRSSNSQRENMLPIKEIRQAPNGPHQSNATQQPNEPSAKCQDTLHLLLCIDKENSGTPLQQEQLEGINTDRQLFLFLRSKYFRQWNVRNWLTLRNIGSLSLSRFAVDFSNFAEVHQHVSICEPACVCLPPVDRLDREYRCRPAPEVKPKYEPAIGTQRLTHYFLSPQCVNATQKTILAQLPKRVGYLSASSDQEEIGWGIHFQEGWHWRTVNFVVIILVASFSLVFAIVWSITKSDIQGAFAVSSFWLTLGTLLLGYMALRSL